MTFTDYANNRFQEIVSDQKTKFTLARHAESQSLQFLLKAATFAFSVACLFKIIGHYALVAVGIAHNPQPVLDLEQKAAEEQAKAKAKADANRDALNDMFAVKRREKK